GRILERAGIEKCSGDTRMAIRILPRHQISTLPPIRVGKVAIAVGDRVPVPGRESGNTGNLPTTENLVSRAVQAAAEMLAVSNGQIINVAEHEPVADVEIGVPAFPLGKSTEETRPAIVGRSQIGRRRIVDGVAPGVRGQEGQSPREPFLKAGLQRVVNRGAARCKIGNASIEHWVTIPGTITLLHWSAGAERRTGIARGISLIGIVEGVQPRPL